MKAGQISKAFQARDADYMVQLVEALPAGTPDFASKRDEVLRAWRETQQRASARQKATALQAAIAGGRGLREAARRAGPGARAERALQPRATTCPASAAKAPSRSPPSCSIPAR